MKQDLATTRILNEGIGAVFVHNAAVLADLFTSAPAGSLQLIDTNL